MDLSEEDQRVQEEAVRFIKSCRKKLAAELTDPDVFTPEKNPVSVFMAGSPGAGKTESSIELLKLRGGDGSQILRIDPDDLRKKLPGYNGANSWLFQYAVTLLVEKIHDLALEQGQSFLLDGTLSNYEKAVGNIKRSLRRDRMVQILYVYQEPKQAWEFVQIREETEGRRIKPEDFINHYFGAREVVNKLKERFGKEIQVDLLMKNNDGSRRFYRAGIDLIDNHVPEKYDICKIRKMIGLD